jgi:hypothetical protein
MSVYVYLCVTLSHTYWRTKDTLDLLITHTYYFHIYTHTHSGSFGALALLALALWHWRPSGSWCDRLTGIPCAQAYTHICCVCVCVVQDHTHAHTCSGFYEHLYVCQLHSTTSHYTSLTHSRLRNSYTRTHTTIRTQQYVQLFTHTLTQTHTHWCSVDKTIK